MGFPRRLALAVLAISAAAPASAREDFQQWVTLSGQLSLSEKISLQNEVVARFSDDRGGLYEIENATMVGYKLSGAVTASAGYVHNPQYIAGRFTITERRARAQIAVKDLVRLGSVSLDARLRLEQRWRDTIGEAAWRARPYLRLRAPLGGPGAPIINVSAEPFINLNDTEFQAADGVDRLRSAVTLTVPLSAPISLDIGYLNQRRFARGGPDSEDHAMTATLSIVL